MTDLDSVGTDEAEDDEEPDVGEEREDHGNDEDRVRLYPSGLPCGDDGHADGGDDEEVEGSRPHDEAGAQLILLEVIEENPNDGQQDLRRRAGTCKYRVAGWDVAGFSLLPSDMSTMLATVPFQMGTSTTSSSPSSPDIVTCLVVDVMESMEHMKMSATIKTATKL